jgi:hypothetical protein
MRTILVAIALLSGCVSANRHREELADVRRDERLRCLADLKDIEETYKKKPMNNMRGKPNRTSHWRFYEDGK